MWNTQPVVPLHSPPPCYAEPVFTIVSEAADSQTRPKIVKMATRKRIGEHSVVPSKVWKHEGRDTRVPRLVTRSATAFALPRLARKPVPGQEIKGIDHPSVAVPVVFDPATVGTAFNIILAGAAAYNRIGRKVNLKNINLHYNLVTQGSLGSKATYVRVVLVYDRQTNGAAPPWSLVFAATDGSGTVTSDVFSPVNLSNRDRFEILRDDHYMVPDIPALEAPTPDTCGFTPTMDELKRHHFVPLTGRDTVYSASGGTVGDVSTGGLFFFVLGGTDSSTNGTWKVRVDARLRYYE